MYYTDSHEWVHIEGDTGRVGITAHAKEELGDIVFLELPAVGKKLRAGEEAVILESTKAAADIYTPISGEIIAVNEAVKTNPDLLNTSPEEKGWLFQIRLSNLKELESLMNKEAYQQLIDS